MNEKAIITETGELIIDAPTRPLTKFMVVDHDMMIHRYSACELQEYYAEHDDEDTFQEIISAIREQGFFKRYDDEAGVSVFACDDYSVFEEQLSGLDAAA